MYQRCDGTLRNHFKKKEEKKLFSFFVFTMSCKFNLVPFVCPTFKQTGFVVNSFSKWEQMPYEVMF